MQETLPYAPMYQKVGAMRNLIISYKKLPETLRTAFHALYPEGYDDVAFELEVTAKKLIYRAVRMNFDGVSYLIKVDQRPKIKESWMEDEW